MSCVSRLSCLELPGCGVVVKPRRSQVSPIFEPWVPPAFFQKEFDVSEITGGKLSPSHDRSAQGRIRSNHAAGTFVALREFPAQLGPPELRTPGREPGMRRRHGCERRTALWSSSTRV